MKAFVGASEMAAVLTNADPTYDLQRFTEISNDGMHQSHHVICMCYVFNTENTLKGKAEGRIYLFHSY